MVEETETSGDDVWVVVETHKGVGAVFSYRGLTTRDELDGWVSGELAGALTLRSAYWLDEDHGRLMPVVVGRHGEFRNGTGTLHLAADTIVIVMELRAPDAGVLEDKPGQVFQLGAVRSTSQPPGPQSERTPDDDGNE